MDTGQGVPDAIRVQALRKHFQPGKPALQDVGLSIRPGEMVALLGASGSGKSTLLRHLAGLVTADNNSPSMIEIHGCCLQRGGRLQPQVRRLRAEIGFVFQQFNLVERLPVLTNVLAGALHRTPSWRAWLGLFQRVERERALQMLARVGMVACAHQRASTLSGGQQQRAAIARTLLQGARVILADEPIASLDPESARNVMEILARINREDQCTVLVSLHQVDVAVRYCARVVALHKGRVVYDGPAAALTPAVLRDLYDGPATLALRS